MLKTFTIFFLIIRGFTFLHCAEENSSLAAQNQYHEVLRSAENKEWKQLEKVSSALINDFSSSLFSRDAIYFLGLSYFNQEEYELANAEFTKYLTSQSTPKYFEEALRNKFEIAEKYRLGARKHLMGMKTMPKWLPARSDAITIYDEVIAALPHHDLAAHSLYGKAQVYSSQEEYSSAIEAYQTLIRRFNKHPLAIESYIGIGQIYLMQSQREYPDPDFLDLAELNLNKFQASFPSEEKVAVAKQNHILMQEHYASSLFDTARFYERTSKWGAAKIYYTKIVKSYPDSNFAKQSQSRLPIVEDKIVKLEAKKASTKK